VPDLVTGENASALVCIFGLGDNEEASCSCFSGVRVLDFEFERLFLLSFVVPSIHMPTTAFELMSLSFSKSLLTPPVLRVNHACQWK